MQISKEIKPEYSLHLIFKKVHVLFKKRKNIW